MVPTNLIAILLLAILSNTVSAVALPAADLTSSSEKFVASTIVTKGSDAKFGDLVLQSFHTGAGESVVIGAESHGTRFVLQKGHLVYPVGDYPFRIGLGGRPPRSNAPAGYNEVTLNPGDGTAGFSLSPSRPDGSAANILFKKAKFQSFALCNVNGIDPYQSVGPEKQLLWRPEGVQAVYGGKCADVRLEAEFLN